MAGAVNSKYSFFSVNTNSHSGAEIISFIDKPLDKELQKSKGQNLLSRQTKYVGFQTMHSDSDGPIASNKSDLSIFDFLIFYWFK